jgi:hypothetical protein
VGSIIGTPFERPDPFNQIMNEVTPQVSNPLGRPKGSKNKITLLKLMTEEAVRAGEQDKMLEVCKLIIDDALKGDFDCRKLVWQSIMSKSGVEHNQSLGEVPQIIIRTEGTTPKVKQIEVLEGVSSEVVDTSLSLETKENG